MPKNPPQNPLMANRFGRFRNPHEKKVGAVLLTQDNDGKTIYEQHHGTPTTATRELRNLSTMGSPKKPGTHATANTPGGTKMHARTRLDLNIQTPGGTKRGSEVLLFSPDHPEKPFIAKKLSFEEIAERVGDSIATSSHFQEHIDNGHLQKRHKIARENQLSQLEVKGYPALDAIRALLHELKAKAPDAEVTSAIEKLLDLRQEWLHICAYSLTSENEDPQVAKNMVAGSSSANTNMMVPEDLARYFAKQGMTVNIEPAITHLKKFDVALDIHYKLSITTDNGMKCECSFHINPLDPTSLASVYDRIQIADIMMAQMKKTAPTHKSVIKVGP